MNRLSFGLFLVGLISTSACANVIVKAIPYEQGGVKFQGWLAYDDSVQGARPGILVFPEWWGLTDYPKHRAQMLAQMGYVAFAVDMYGEGKTTDSADEAGKMMNGVEGDPSLMRARANAALDVLSKDSHVDPSKIAAIGYCMGGSVALELARSGARLTAVVSFHGGLATKNPDDAKNITGKVLVCTGGDDAFVPPTQVQAFEDEMRQGKVDYQIIVYGGAHHAFTNPDADRHHIDNIAYNAAADKRSWEAMQQLFHEVFGS